VASAPPALPARRAAALLRVAAGQVQGAMPAGKDAFSTHVVACKPEDRRPVYHWHMKPGGMMCLAASSTAFNAQFTRVEAW
jgi:hypothetical protein